jgi:hypothetical protein
LSERSLWREEAGFLRKAESRGVRRHAVFFFIPFRSFIALPQGHDHAGTGL